MYRRFVLIIIALMLVGIIVTSCGGGGTSGPASPGGKEGGTITVGWGRVVSGLDPSVWTSRFDRMLMTQLYTPLIWEVEAYQFEPGMAKEWKVNDDYSEITFFLREDINLTDGTHFNADSLLASWERILDPATASLQTRMFEDIDAFEKVDEYTVKVTFDGPNYRIINHFADLWASPNSIAAAGRLGDEYGLNPVSYGPYKIESWPDETTLVMVRNEEYDSPNFIEGPYVDKIVWKIIPESTSRLVALEGGEVDIIWDPSKHEIRNLEQDPDFQIATYASPGLPQGYMPNVTVSPTNEKSVRLALLYGLDRVEISDLAWFGVNPPAYSPLASASWAYWSATEEEYGYNPEKAKQLLDEAGWLVNSQSGIREKDGKTLTVRLLASARADYEISVERWRAIGFDAILEAMAYEAQVSRMADNDYELARLGLSGTDPDVLWAAFHSTQITGGAQFNRSRIADQRLDQLLDSGTQFADIDKRAEIYTELQQYILSNGWFIPSYEDVYVWASGKDVRGFDFNLGGNPVLSEVWLDQ